MTAFEQVLQAAQQLPESQRRELINLLIEEIAPNPEQLTAGCLSESQWQEIDRRMAEYDAEPTKSISWEAVRARVLARRGGNG